MNKLFISPEHVLQGGYFHSTLRKLQEPNTTIESHNLMFPVFLLENDDAIETINGMPNVYRYGLNKLIPTIEELVDKGLKSILIFGIIESLGKDATGSNADSDNNPVVRALPVITSKFPDLLVACDVCLCPYTSHGHCGILLPNGKIDHGASVARIAEVALKYAKAGAHVVAPSDMMDNRIKAIKDVLVSNKLENQVSVLSYSCKFASSLYGPFRDTMKSSPMQGDRKCYQLPPGSSGLAARAAVSVLSYSCKFASSLYGPFRDTMKSSPMDGDRKCYQLPPGSSGLAARAAARDVAEGADCLMVKPGLPYLDIVRQTKDQFPNHPLFVYQVSGEYVMLERGGDRDVLYITLMELLTSMRRAGADCIITYFVPLLLDVLSKK